VANRLNLDRGAILSRRVPRGQYTVSVADDRTRNRNWLVAGFGSDDRRKHGRHPVWVTTWKMHSSQRAGATAGRDADLVAWLLTNCDELIRLARIGQEHDRG
jgi:hypothetical protein